jgi:hypothetical protein
LDNPFHKKEPPHGIRTAIPVAGPSPRHRPAEAAALFIWLVEARDAFVALDAVAGDATLPPRRRRLARSDARARYEQAHTSLAWLLVIDPVAATQPPSPASDAGNRPRHESWAE